MYIMSLWQGPVDFASKIIGIIGIQKQQAKCWHNRSTVEQRSSKIKQNQPTDSISSLTLHRHLKQTQLTIAEMFARCFQSRTSSLRAKPTINCFCN